MLYFFYLFFFFLECILFQNNGTTYIEYRQPKFIMETRLFFLRKWQQGILPTINLNNIPFYLPQSQLKQLQKEIFKKQNKTQIYQGRTYFQ